MKRKLLFILVLLISVTKLFAQHEADNWYFGYNAGMNFSGGSPVALTNGAVTSDEGFSSISDSNGNLLFYTNSVKVWDRNHQLMPNGTGLFGHTSSTQSLIVKRPGWSGRYYIFTLDIVFSDFPDNGFNYSEVDMSLNGGFGDIIPTLKNINLVSDSMSEKICGVKHSNGNDIWVLVHKWNSNMFYSYLVTTTGINPPIINNIGSIQTGFDSQGQMKFTLSGNKVGLAAQETGYFEIFDFDKANGTLSNPLLIMDTLTWSAYGLEFSPDGSKLYVSNSYLPDDTIYQYNLLAGSDSLIIASRVSLGSINVVDHVGQLQLGPDGKIYIVKVSQIKLAVINNPNNIGLSCNLSPNGFQLLPPGLNGIGLPNFVASYLLPTGIAENTSTTNFSIYPNPFTEKLNVERLKLKVGEQANIVIYDLIGEIVFEKQLSSNNTSAELNLSFLQQGVYFLNVKSACPAPGGNGESWTKKIVKM